MVYAARLPKLTPGAYHLVHMPSHTYIRTGDYHLGSMVNAAAVEVDSLYVSACHAAGAYPLGLYPHNFHFLSACAAFEGRSNLSRRRPGAWWLSWIPWPCGSRPGNDTALLVHSILLIREVRQVGRSLTEPRPAEDLPYPIAIWHYARGWYMPPKGSRKMPAGNCTGCASPPPTPWWKALPSGTSTHTSLLQIAYRVLEAEIANREGDAETAIRLLEEAIQMEDGT
ncbi:MAG: hypothetical protein H6559_18930 [Lewinellaceae bacterium]|nr:hypothetical protein [Lewinellaceae bacterium]